MGPVNPSTPPTPDASRAALPAAARLTSDQAPPPLPVGVKHARIEMEGRVEGRKAHLGGQVLD